MTIFTLHSEPLQEEWQDAYGHLNEAYYLVPFSNASWALLDHFATGEDYFQRTGGALYTVEGHLRLLKEVRAPACSKSTAWCWALIPSASILRIS